MDSRASGRGIAIFAKDSLNLIGPVRPETRGRYLFSWAVVFFFAYSIPNRLHLFTPEYLKFTYIDLVVPIVPWTVLIYISEYIFFYVAYLMIRDEQNYNRYLWSIGFVEAISVIFFIFFPTTYPRADFPIPAGTPEIFALPFRVLRIVDDPSNSFPSLHVSACFVTAFIFLKEARWKFLFFVIWATLISISTLTTKQHYFLDVVAGFALAMVAAYIFIIKAHYRAPDEPLIQ